MSTGTMAGSGVRASSNIQVQKAVNGFIVSYYDSASDKSVIYVCKDLEEIKSTLAEIFLSE